MEGNTTTANAISIVKVRATELRVESSAGVRVNRIETPTNSNNLSSNYTHTLSFSHTQTQAPATTFGLPKAKSTNDVTKDKGKEAKEAKEAK